MHGLEMQCFAMKFRALTVPLKFPCENGSVAFVVAKRLALGRLMFLAKMGARRFIPLQRIDAHQLGEFEEIRDSPSALQRLVIISFVSRHPHVAPKLFAQFRNSSERFAQSFLVAGHPAFVPKEQAEFAMERIERAPSVDLQ